MQDTTLSPAEFVALLNQTLEAAWPVVAIEGELSDFRVSKNKWVYFDLKDEEASVRFFGSIYNLPGPLEDGLIVRVVGAPRLHPRFGFTVNVQSIVPVGEGALRKAAELLRRKLEAEGLFVPERKRALPAIPERIGLITAASSAAYVDFLKILNERWGGLEIQLIDVYVQGEQAPVQIVSAIEEFNKRAEPPEVLVITRGGGSLDDLAAFSDERVVRAVAASRVPTLVAIGHEVDLSLAELAADMRASTPTNAAGLLVPDKHHELAALALAGTNLGKVIGVLYEDLAASTAQSAQQLKVLLKNVLASELDKLIALKRLAELLSPRAALKRGYAIIFANGRYVTSVKHAAKGDKLSAELSDGTIHSIVQALEQNASKN